MPKVEVPAPFRLKLQAITIRIVWFDHLQQCFTIVLLPVSIEELKVNALDCLYPVDHIVHFDFLCQNQISSCSGVCKRLYLPKGSAFKRYSSQETKSRGRFAGDMALHAPATDARNKESNKNPLILMFLLLIAAFNVQLLWIAKDKVVEGYGDFASFYAGGLIVRNGRGHELYNYETQREVQRPLFANVDTREDALPFVHLAYEALVYVPFAFLSYSFAVKLWILLNIVMLAVISIWLPLPVNTQRISRVFLFLSLFASFPILVTLIQGQDCIILLLLYSATFYCMKSERNVLAGAILAFGLFKFQLVLPFVGIFLLMREWKFILGFFGASIIPILTSIYVAGIQSTFDYLRFLSRFSQSPSGQFEIEPSKMPNLRGVLYSALSGILSPRTLLVVTVLCSLALLVWAIKSLSSAAIEIRFSLAVLVSTAVSHYLFVYDLAIAVVPLFLVLAMSGRHHTFESRFYQPVFVTLTAILLMSPTNLAMINYGVDPSWAGIPLLALTLLVCQYAKRSKSASSSGNSHSEPLIA